jgi:hypothetical protein
MQRDLFGSKAESDNPIVGVTATLPDRPCRQCGDIAAVIESTGKGPHHGSLRCDCGQFRGWLRKETYDFVTASIKQFGKPTGPITIRTQFRPRRANSRAAMPQRST